VKKYSHFCLIEVSGICPVGGDLYAKQSLDIVEKNKLPSDLKIKKAGSMPNQQLPCHSE
jgi:hypothetical protein